MSEVDTAGRYWFFYTGNIPDPPFSSHVTTDGYYVDIYYDGHPQFNMTDIKCELL